MSTAPLWLRNLSTVPLKIENQYNHVANTKQIMPLPPHQFATPIIKDVASHVSGLVSRAFTDIDKVVAIAETSLRSAQQRIHELEVEAQQKDLRISELTQELRIASATASVVDKLLDIQKLRDANERLQKELHALSGNHIIKTCEDTIDDDDKADIKDTSDEQECPTSPTGPLIEGIPQLIMKKINRVYMRRSINGQLFLIANDTDLTIHTIDDYGKASHIVGHCVPSVSQPGMVHAIMK